MHRERLGLARFVIGFGVALLGGLALRASLLRPVPAGRALASVVIRDVPHESQKPDFCGEACAAMWLHKLGTRGDQDWVFDQSGLSPKEGRGVYASELARALVHIGFQIGRGWSTLVGSRSDIRAPLARLFEELHADLARGVPSIVCMHYDQTPDTTEHFRLILGYDAGADEVSYHEPAEADGAYRRMSRAQFLTLWPLRTGDSEWTVVRFRLAGRPAQEAPPGDVRTGADYAQHVLSLKARLPAGFQVAVVPPFVVVGDSTPEVFRLSTEGSVAWAVKHLKALYFPKDPDEIVDIWLFKDAGSYSRHLAELFDETDPGTPYGFYSLKHRALFMNISTGGGTLVHEIVHPYVHANFPAAPPWLNEGLGSLYEQCDEADGKIVGLVNWRLAGLQLGIRQGSLPSLRTLTAADDGEFYGGRHSDTTYAQARYLLYYLQERGLLQTFYRRFHAAREVDPTGYRTLQLVLAEPDMAAFQARWERWVLSLEFKEE